MKVEEYLDETLQRLEGMAGGDKGLVAAMFWEALSRLSITVRYLFLQECAARNWIIPADMQLFREYYELTPAYAAKRDYLEFRRGWLADKYNDQTYWRKISGMCGR